MKENTLTHDLPLLYAGIANGKGLKWVKFRIAQTMQEEEKARSPDTCPLFCLEDLQENRNI